MEITIIWECECGNDNLCVPDEYLELGINEVDAICQLCGQCITLEVNVRVLPRKNDSNIKRVFYKGE